MPGIEIGGSHGQSRPVTVINEKAHAFLRALSGECWSEEREEAFAAHSPDSHSSDTSGVPPTLPSAAEGAALPRLISRSKNQGGSRWLKLNQGGSRHFETFFYENSKRFMGLADFDRGRMELLLQIRGKPIELELAEVSPCQKLQPF